MTRVPGLSSSLPGESFQAAAALQGKGRQATVQWARSAESRKAKTARAHRVEGYTDTVRALGVCRGAPCSIQHSAAPQLCVSKLVEAPEAGVATI